MKYKLLNKKGAHFVCLEDGTQIPLQVSATVQVMFEKCRTTVKAFCDERMGLPEDPKLRFENGVLTYGKYVLEGAQVLSYKKGTQGPEWEPGTICFIVECDLPDTIEQPKPYSNVLFGDPGPELIQEFFDKHPVNNAILKPYPPLPEVTQPITINR